MVSEQRTDSQSLKFDSRRDAWFRVTMDSPASPTPGGSDNFGEFAKRLATVSAAILAIGIICLGAQVFLLLFAGILFAVFLCNLSSWLAARTRLSRRWALAAVTLGLMTAAAGTVSFAAPRVAQQADDLRRSLPRSMEKLETELNRYRLGTAAVEAAEHPARYLPEGQVLVKRVTGVFSTTLGALGALLVVLFTGFCIAIEPHTYRRGLLSLLPRRSRERGGQVLENLRTTLGLWLLAKTASMAVVAVLTGAGLWILDMPLVFTLSLLAAALAFIPNLGPILAAAPAVLLGLLESPEKAFYVVLLYLTVQTIESYVITPLIERRTVNLPPALAVTAQLLLGILTGTAGLILAAPLTVAVMVLVRNLYIGDADGGRSKEDGAW